MHSTTPFSKEIFTRIGLDSPVSAEFKTVFRSQIACSYTEIWSCELFEFRHFFFFLLSSSDRTILTVEYKKIDGCTFAQSCRGWSLEGFGSSSYYDVLI